VSRDQLGLGSRFGEALVGGDEPRESDGVRVSGRYERHRLSLVADEPKSDTQVTVRVAPKLHGQLADAGQ